jgi:hypothetical protein
MLAQLEGGGPPKDHVGVSTAFCLGSEFGTINLMRRNT